MVEVFALSNTTGDDTRFEPEGVVESRCRALDSITELYTGVVFEQDVAVAEEVVHCTGHYHGHEGVSRVVLALLVVHLAEFCG